MVSYTLPGSDQLYTMPQPKETIDHPPRRHRHTIDFRRIGFGHDRDTQLTCRVSKMLERKRRVHERRC